MKNSIQSILQSMIGKNHIRDEKGDRHGLIDENGNVILPCEYDVSWAGISCEQKRIVFKDGDKHGIKDFDGNIIVPPDLL